MAGHGRRDPDQTVEEVCVPGGGAGGGRAQVTLGRRRRLLQPEDEEGAVQPAHVRGSLQK